MELSEGMKYHENGIILNGKFVYVEELGEMWLEKGVLSSKFGDRFDGIWRNFRKVGEVIKCNFRGLVKFYGGNETFEDCLVSITQGKISSYERQMEKKCYIGELDEMLRVRSLEFVE